MQARMAITHVTGRRMRIELEIGKREARRRRGPRYGQTQKPLEPTA
ncbi:Hypothetical protein A7982_07019 [Minicystis rosea]|nr:Hypothetical protein A7982_07019 [Minicystis rosea]